MSEVKRIAIIGAMDSEITNFKGMIGYCYNYSYREI